MSGGRGFMPDNTQQAARYSVAPLQKLQLRLDLVDRSQGEYIPAPEGTSIYIEKTDWPFLLSFVNPLTNESQCVVARAGVTVNAPFKGIAITHPLLTGPNGQTLSASIVIGHGGACVNNENALPFASTLPPAFYSTNTAAAFLAQVYIPPGAKFLSFLEVTLGAAATVTTASWNISTLVGNGIFAAGGPTLVTPNRNYNVSQGNSGLFDVTFPIAGVNAKAKDANIPVPLNAFELQVSLTGTGFASPNVRAVFA